jgi:hypothetical protein
LSRFVTRPRTKVVSSSSSVAIILLDRCLPRHPRPLPPGFSAAAGLPESEVHRPADTLASRQAVGPPPSALRMRPTSSPSYPGLRGSSSPYSLCWPPPHPPPLRHPPRPPGLHRRRAPCRPARRRLRPRINIAASSCCLYLQPHGCPPQRR